jgi:hypothetical protein
MYCTFVSNLYNNCQLLYKLDTNVRYPIQVHILSGSENNIVIEWKTNLCYIPFYKFEKCKDDDIVRLIINVSALTSFILQNNNV